MKDDPAISRVREARHRISEECGHDPKRLVDYYMERQRQRQEKLKDEFREAEPEKESTKGKVMGNKKVTYSKTGIDQLPNDKPVVYRIQSEGGTDNYIGIAKRGRVSERVAEHLGKVPGATVSIQQHSSIQDARDSEARLIKRNQPKYNDPGR